MELLTKRLRITPFTEQSLQKVAATFSLIKWAFSFYNVERVIAECHEDNVASIRVLEKLQMKRTKPENNMLNWEIEKKHFLERV